MPLTNLNKITCAQSETKFSLKIDNSQINYRTILLIDDEEMVVKITEAMLKKIGYKILKANSGHEGLKLFRKYQHQIDYYILPRHK